MRSAFVKMRRSARTESQRLDAVDGLCSYWGSFFECRCLRFFWSPQLARKWLQFQATGDDFRADHYHHQVDHVSSAADDEEQSYLRTESVLRSRDKSDIYTDYEHDADLKWTSRPLLRSQSETPRKQNVDTTEYRIAVGTWNVAGIPPPEELDCLDHWLDSSEEADIYVLGFQEVVPLNAGNVLCAEDEGPAAVWEDLIRQALNSKSALSALTKSPSAPPSPCRDISTSEVRRIDIERINEGVVANEEKISSFSMKAESSRQSTASPKKSQYENSKERSSKANTETSRGGSIEGRFISDNMISASDSAEDVNRRLSVDEGLLQDAELSTGPEESVNSFLEEEESLRIPLFKPNAVREAFNRDHPSQIRSRFSRIASKQMAGLFITVWVRSDLRRDVHDVKVSCVGCGILGYLGNKGSISVSMCLHQTSFCFVNSHLTSGHNEGDELRRNADVAEILRRTCFPRSPQAWQLPETIMTHDCKIWFGDLNYRLSLPDLEVRSLVASEQWSELLEMDQLKLEQDAGHVFEGWQEGPIYFRPTYKYAINSDRYSGGSGASSGEKIRAPAWCDRILWLGKALRKTRYIRTESKLSDHRPVSATFVAEVESVGQHKMKRAATSILNASAPRGGSFFAAASVRYNFSTL